MESTSGWFARKFKRKEQPRRDGAPRDTGAVTRGENKEPVKRGGEGGAPRPAGSPYDRLYRPIDAVDRIDGNNVLAAARKFLNECGPYRSTSTEFRNEYAKTCENLYLALNALATMSRTMISVENLSKMQVEAMRLVLNLLFVVREEADRVAEEKQRPRSASAGHEDEDEEEEDEEEEGEGGGVALGQGGSVKRASTECVYEHSKVWFAVDEQASSRCDVAEKLVDVMRLEPLHGLALYNIAFLIKQMSNHSLWHTAHHHIELGYRMLATLNEQGTLHAAALERKLEMESISIPFPHTAVAAVIHSVAAMVNVELMVLPPDTGSVGYMRRFGTLSASNGFGSESASSAGINPFYEGSLTIMAERDRIRGENAEIVRESTERVRNATRIFVELPTAAASPPVRAVATSGHRRASSVVSEIPINTQEMYATYASAAGLPPRSTRNLHVRIATSSSNENLARRYNSSASCDFNEAGESDSRDPASDSGSAEEASPLYRRGLGGNRVSFTERIVPLSETAAPGRTARLLQRGSDASKSRDDLLLGLRSPRPRV